MKNVETNDIDIRDICPDKMQVMVALHRAVFPVSQWAKTIYASEKVWRYLSNLVVFPTWQNEHVFLGAWFDQSLIGYAHFRALPESWHLNQIVVDKQFQGRGIGNKLFTFWIDEGNRRGYKRLTLDVLQSNHKALQWYERQGFNVTKRSWVYEEELSPPSSPGFYRVELKEWLAAEAWQAFYGFSEFQLGIAREDWCVGRLGDNYFRITKYPSEALRQVLFKMSSQRCLLILSQQQIECLKCKLVQIVLRMEL